MTHNESCLPALTLRVVYEDVHLIQIEARLVAGDWSAVSRAYTSRDSLGETARSLLAWVARLHDEVAFEAGIDNGTGWLCVRWYRIDRAGHVACHVRMATAAYDGRPEEVRRLALEFDTEPGLIERFARQLASVAESHNNEAVLSGV